VTIITVLIDFDFLDLHLEAVKWCRQLQQGFNKETKNQQLLCWLRQNSVKQHWQTLHDKHCCI